MLVSTHKSFEVFLHITINVQSRHLLASIQSYAVISSLPCAPYVATGAQANASLGTGGEERNSTCYQESKGSPKPSADFSFPFHWLNNITFHTHHKEIWEILAFQTQYQRKRKQVLIRLPKVNQPGLIPYKSLFLTDQSQSPIMLRSQFSPLYIKGEWCSMTNPKDHVE